MAHNPFCLHFINNSTLENLTIRFCSGLKQAPIQTPHYMNIPKEYKTPKDQNNHPMVLKLIHNIYGQKQGLKVWGDFLHQGLTKASFKLSQVDPCLYYHPGLICFSLYR